MGALLLGLLAAAPAVATPVAHPIAFVTSVEGTAKFSTWGATSNNLDGPAGADAVCQNLAEAAGLATAGVPVFRAWIADVPPAALVTDPYCHVQGLGGQKNDCDGAGSIPLGPWWKTNGTPFAPALGPLTIDGPVTPLDRDENGAYVPYSEYWTGGDSDGGVTGSTFQCSNWTSESGSAWVGTGSATAVYWAGKTMLPCSALLHLACFQATAGDALPIEPWQPAALAFVTSNNLSAKLETWPENTAAATGIAAGDSICRTFAANGHLPGADFFLAYLSDSASIAAKDRLSINGPWSRLDHYRVADDLVELTSGRLKVPIAVDETGAVPYQVQGEWTGTNIDGTPTGAACGDWTSNSSGDVASWGKNGYASSEWIDLADNAACSGGKALYCLGDKIVIFWNDFEGGLYTPPWSVTVGMTP